MCGRTACTLAPNAVCKASSLPSNSNSGKNTFSCPQWKDHPGSYKYSPSTNVAPTTFCPVLIRDSPLKSSCKRDIEGNEKNEKNYVVQPMMWGLIPPFFKGDSPKGHGFKTSNCRLEDIEERKSYKPSLNKGQRCVVLCDGFYEWQTTKGNKSKQPYFIYAPQINGIEIWNKQTELCEEQWSEEEGWKGIQLLKMAGLYSHWTSSEGEEVYSFTIITMESGEGFKWLHHRIPAILETHDDVKRWLDEPDYKVAISQLRNETMVSTHPVSTLVNNSRNQDEHLLCPMSEEKLRDTAGSKFMSAWLNSSSEKTKKDEIKKELNRNEVKKENVKKEQKGGIMKWLKKE